MGAVGMAETGIVGTAGTVAVGMTETSTVGMVETGVEGMVEMCVTRAAGEVAIGIVVSAATSDSLKVSVIRRIDIQSESRLHQEVMQMHIRGRRKKKLTIKGEEKI